ncbi:MAG: CHASE3 domain-containing protein [Bryobacteraceae bacterium]
MKPEPGSAIVPRTTEILSLLVALVLVLAIAAITALDWTAYRSGADRVVVLRQIAEASTSLLSELTDAETGERGFLLTGKESYLEPYRSALQEIPKTFLKLDQTAGADPEGARRVEALRPLVREELRELEETIDLRRTKGADAALAEVINGRGKEVMDEIRQGCAAVGAQEYVLLNREREVARADARRAGIISIGGSVALFALLTWSVITIHRATRRRQELIAALQQSEEQIRQARDWLQTTLRSIGDGVIATDAGGRVTFLNEAAQSLTGWTQEEAVGVPFDRVFAITNEKTGAIAENPVSGALLENKAVDLLNHTLLTAKDGRKTPIEDTAAPIRNSQGEVVGGVLVFRDVIERRKAELFEAAVKERYRFFAEAGRELSSSLDFEQTLQHIARLAVPAFADYCNVDLLDEGRIHSVAHAHIDPVKDALLVEKRGRFPLRIQQQHPVAEVFRTGRAVLIPKTLDVSLVAAAENEEHLALLRRLAQCSAIVVPLKARNKTLGTITFATGQTESGRIYDESDLAWATEIAQRAALALDNARLYREAHDAQQAAERSRAALAQINDELQQFAFATSHDLREPLRTINIYAEMLQRRTAGKLDEKSDECLNFVLAGASQMDRLINALLDYSKAGEVTSEPVVEVDLEAVLISTLGILRQAIAEAGAVVTHDLLPRITGSELHIGQLFQNLIGNAVKYRRSEAPRVHVSAGNSGEGWLFTISDNGQGIPPDQFSNIFTVFARLHGHDYPGTGIGLATCRKIVERNGGRIWVESEVGKGSTFFFTLPGFPEQPSNTSVCSDLHSTA